MSLYQYDNDTAIKVTQSKFYAKYKNFSQASDTEKSELRDYMIRYYMNIFAEKGYTCTINKADYFKDCIKIGFTVRKNNFTGRMVTTAYIKDFVAYCVTALCVDATAAEVLNTLSTMKIDGVEFETWIRQ